MKINLRLLEGRKQIQSMLAKLPDSDRWVDFVLSLDPSRTKKYANIIAKNFRDECVSGIGRGWKLDVILEHMMGVFEDNYKDKLLDLIPKAETKNISIDLSKIKTVSELIQILARETKRITRSSMKKGFEGLTEGEDYTIMYSNDNISAIMPHSWKASRTLASDSVGGVEGEWCIAYQKTDSYWNDIVVKQGQVPVFFININKVDEDSWGKFAFMYKEDGLDIWDQNNNILDNNEEGFKTVGITKQINNEIWSKVRGVANDRIEDFSIGGTEEITELRYNFSVNLKDMTFNGDVYVNLIEISSRNGEFIDSKEVDSGSTEGKLMTGKQFFSTEDGKLFIEKLIKDYEDGGSDMTEIPDLIRNTIVVLYDNNEPFSIIKRRIENANSYDESDWDETTYDLKQFYRKTGVESILFISNEDLDILEEPMYEKLPFKRSWEVSGEFESTSGTLKYNFEANTDNTLADVLGNDPNVFIRDDAQEAKHGQQFLQFESLKKQIKALIG